MFVLWHNNNVARRHDYMHLSKEWRTIDNCSMDSHRHIDRLGLGTPGPKLLQVTSDPSGHWNIPVADTNINPIHTSTDGEYLK